MKNLTPILSHPTASQRVGEMCEQVRTDRDRARHDKVWWHDQEYVPPKSGGGCAVALIALSFVLYAVGAAWIFLF